MRKYIGLFVILSLFIVTNAFGGPFGIDFGMSLEQVRQISKTTPKNRGKNTSTGYLIIEYYSMNYKKIEGIPISEILDDYPLLKEIHIKAALAFSE